MFKTCKKPPMSIISASGDICSFKALQAGIPLKSHSVAVTGYQSGSGTPSPSNPRPISGYSAINIGNDNVYTDFIEFNQLLAQNKLISSTSINGLDITNNNDGSFTIDGTSEALFNLELTTAITVPRKSHKVLIRFNTLPTNVTLFVSGYGAASGFNSSYFFYKTDGTDWTNGKLSLTIPLGKVFDNFRLWLNYYDLTVMFGETEADEIYNQGDAGLTYFKSLFPNDYYEYDTGTLSTVSGVNGVSGSYFNVQFGSTIYGGNYDAVSGVLTVTHGMVDLGTLNWNRYTTQSTNKTYFRTSAEISDCIKSTNVSITYGLVCSNYIEGAWTYVLDDIGHDFNFALGWGNKSYIAIYDTGKSEMTTAEFKTAMNGVQLIYPLATPQTIQLPPCPIEPLLGENNIFADCGSTSIEAFQFGR